MSHAGGDIGGIQGVAGVVRAHMMVHALLPGCSTMQEATNHSEARRSKEPPAESDPSRQ